MKVKKLQYELLAAQPDLPHHPPPDQVSPSRSAAHGDTAPPAPIGRGGEYLFSQLNCPNPWALNPGAHSVSFPLTSQPQQSANRLDRVLPASCSKITTTYWALQPIRPNLMPKPTKSFNLLLTKNSRQYQQPLEIQEQPVIIRREL